MAEKPWPTEPPKVWVVLPAFNEQDNLWPLLEQLDQTRQLLSGEMEVVIVDDGSSDGTADVATHASKHLPVTLLRHEQNMGLGPTIRDGLRHAAQHASPRDAIISMDADNSHKPGLIPSMLDHLGQGAELVIASRYQPGALIRGVPRVRIWTSNVASWLFRLIFPIPGVRDYTCGYRAYRAELLQRAFDQYGESFVDQDGFQCMVDILLKLARLDPPVREVPMILRYDLKEGPSKMNVSKTIGATIRLMVHRRIER